MKNLLIVKDINSHQEKIKKLGNNFSGVFLWKRIFKNNGGKEMFSVILKKSSILYILITIIIILFLFIFIYNHKVSTTKDYLDITIAAYEGDSAALIYITKDQGFFKDFELNVTINDYEAGKLATDALLAGKADIATATDSVFVSNSFKHPIRTIGTVALAYTNRLIARKDFGINSINDIKGKKIAVTRKSTGEYYLGRFLTYHNLSWADIELVDLPPSEIVKAVLEGKVAAAFSWDPYIYRIEKELSSNAISWQGQSGQAFNFILISKKIWLNKNQGKAQKLLKALIKGENYIKNNPEKMKEYMEKRFDLSKEFVDDTFARHSYVVVLPQEMIISFEDQAMWRIENKLTDVKNVPNYLDYIYTKTLKEIDPKKITIIK